MFLSSGEHALTSKFYQHTVTLMNYKTSVYFLVKHDKGNHPKTNFHYLCTCPLGGLGQIQNSNNQITHVTYIHTYIYFSISVQNSYKQKYYLVKFFFQVFCIFCFFCCLFSVIILDLRASGLIPVFPLQLIIK